MAVAGAKSPEFLNRRRQELKPQRDLANEEFNKGVNSAYWNVKTKRPDINRLAGMLEVNKNTVNTWYIRWISKGCKELKEVNVALIQRPSYPEDIGTRVLNALFLKLEERDVLIKDLKSKQLENEQRCSKLEEQYNRLLKQYNSQVKQSNHAEAMTEKLNKFLGG